MAAVAVLSAAAAAAALLCARPRPTRHQLVSLMAPNTKGSGFEWKDPTCIYLNGEAFAATVDVLLVRPLPLLTPAPRAALTRRTLLWHRHSWTVWVWSS